ncbi:MAG: cysteine desulfurase [Nitrospinota bacterium]|nr:cysteine desulfurase [Nitrospinota bacterium]
MANYDIERIRGDFPVLSTKVRGKPLVYLDNGATTQKPKAVIDAIYKFESEEYATVRRGSYTLGEAATTRYEEARGKVAKFLNAESHKEIIFTSGATQGINLVAHSFGKRFVNKGDEIIISHMEHHANIVPWQMLCEERGAVLKVIPMNDEGELLMEEYRKLLTERTKMVAVTHISNVLGTVNPVKEITELAHSAGAKVLIDGAQSAPHMKVDVRDIGCDFYVIAGHKMYAPSGVGALYGKYSLLEEMPPYVTGGDMIVTVGLGKSTFAKPPSRFEAGTPPISQVIGLGAAIDYLEAIGFENIERHEHELLEHGMKLFDGIEGLRVTGTSKHKAAIISFHLESAHPHDVVTMLDQDGLCLRGGHHCAQPTMERFGVPATTRASMGVYNRKEELDLLAESIRKVIKMFS